MKVYYPFKVFETESGFKVFDLMGHNKGEVHLLITNEINKNLGGEEIRPKLYHTISLSLTDFIDLSQKRQK